MLFESLSLAVSPLTTEQSAVVSRKEQAQVEQSRTNSPSPVSLSPAELFAFAETAVLDGDYDSAQSAYQALAKNPDLEIRTEARFRLAMMLADKQQRYDQAAVLFRAILDEKPDAARVRIELARMQLLLGNLRSAEREFRAAQASGLPPQVEQLVRFYAQSLSATKSFGFNVELAVAPDSNINRATNSDTLGTIIGDFNLSDDARANSGVGLTARGQAFAKTGIDKHADLLVRISASGDFYRKSAFDDYSVVVQAGPTYRSGRDRITFSALAGWRWFGQSPFSFTYGGNAEWDHPLGERAKLSVNAALTHRDDRFSDTRSADNFALSARIDRALSARFGVGLRLSAQRDAANDPGFSTVSGGIGALAFRELGETTTVLNLSYSHLEADKRLNLFPSRRIDDRYSASLAGTFRALRVGRFAPLLRVSYERNKSSVEINDFRRFAGEVGVTAAF